MSIDPAWIALIGTLCGGAGLKFAEHYLGQSKVRTDDASKIRDELRLEIESQRKEIKELEEGMERWRKDYYDLRDRYVAKETELTVMLERIKHQALGESNNSRGTSQ